MIKEMVKTDSRLFLFQVLEKGLDQTLITGTYLGKLNTQGARMSFAFAKRYYSVVYEACLRQASHCVLGIMNIGLVEASGKNMDDALGLVLQTGYVGLFRQGWTRVLRLVQYAMRAERFMIKSEFEWEKDFSELFSAEPGREWIGHDEYQINMLIYSRFKGKSGLIKLF